MMKWEVEVGSDGHIKDEYLSDGQGRTYCGLTTKSDSLPITGTPSPTFVIETYFRKYWIPFSLLPNGVTQIAANYGLNMGRTTAIMILQQAVGFVKVDGQLGPITTRACYQTDQHELCLKLIELGRAHYEEIGHGSRARFLSGWLNRNKDVAEKFA